MRRLLPAMGCFVLLMHAAQAQPGTSNVAAIEPPTIAHPATMPCVVTLFSGATFGADAVPYAYAPPASCPGPWAKVVLATDISVAAGRQFDRTGTIWLDGVNLWFGTTAEPRAALAPAWHVERDVTDDTALFLHAGTGHVLIANYQTGSYTSAITAHAELRFYPAGPDAPAPRVPDMVVGFGSDAGGDTVALDTGADALSRTLTLPGNIERAAFDAYLQGQDVNDEFWYTCVPDALTDTLQSCGGGALREGELTVDGKPAGVAPVYPVVFTGGIDPYLWEPVPDVSTLDLKPFRMEITPFAGMLDAAGTHTISLSVAGADHYFSVTGTLYLWLDHGASSLAGSLVSDTLAAAPSPSVSTSVGSKGADMTETVDTVSARPFAITGTLQTSHGAVTTTVAGTSRFSNRQFFDIGAASYLQDVVQDTETDQDVTTMSAGRTAVRSEHFSFPIAVSTSLPDLDAATFHQATTIAAGYLATRFGTGVSPSLLAEAIASQDTLAITGSTITGHSGAQSGALYASVARNGCEARVLGSVSNVLQIERQASGCGAVASVAREAMQAGGMRSP